MILRFELCLGLADFQCVFLVGVIIDEEAAVKTLDFARLCVQLSRRKKFLH